MTSQWQALADEVIAGRRIRAEDAAAILRAPDIELLDILSAAFRIRERTFGRTVQLYMLMNIRSGLCPEDCGYCSQSRVSTAAIAKYPLLEDGVILEGAQRAAEWGACTFCLVGSGRGASRPDLDRLSKLVPEIKQRFPLRVCVCLGLLSEGAAEQLHEAGVDRVNHNLNTSEAFYGDICTTHTYLDRLATLQNVRKAGISQCSGCIIGMGESPEDLVAVANELRSLCVASIPVNFLIPVDGTPLEGSWKLTPQYCLKALCMFRFVNPTAEIRIAGGRELHLGALQPLGLYPANSIFLGDYLTTRGQKPEQDFKMIEDLGFEVTLQGGPQPEAVAV